MRKNIEKCHRFGGPKIDPFWGHGNIRKKIRTLRRTPKRVNFWTTKTEAFFSIFLRILEQFFAVFSACLLFVVQALQAELGNLMAVQQNLCVQISVCWLRSLNSPRLILVDSGRNVCHAWTFLLSLSMGHCTLVD